MVDRTNQKGTGSIPGQHLYGTNASLEFESKAEICRAMLTTTSLSSFQSCKSMRVIHSSLPRLKDDLTPSADPAVLDIWTVPKSKTKPESFPELGQKTA